MSPIERLVVEPEDPLVEKARWEKTDSGIVVPTKVRASKVVPHEDMKKLRRIVKLLAQHRLDMILGCLDCKKPCTVKHEPNNKLLLLCDCTIRELR